MVDAHPEGEMPVRVTRHVEAVGLLELCRVAVRARQHHQHRLARAHFVTPQSRVVRHDAQHRLRRGIPAHHLLDRPVEQTPVGAQGLLCLGVLHEGEGAVADHVRGRVVSGQRKVDRQFEQIVRLEPLVVRVRPRQLDHQCALCHVAACREAIEVARELAARFVGGCPLLAREVHTDGRAHHPIRPRHHLVPLLWWRAKLLPDHRLRQRLCELGEQVEWLIRARRIEESRRLGLDERPQTFDEARCERPAHDAPQPCVFRRVGGDHSRRRPQRRGLALLSDLDPRAARSRGSAPRRTAPRRAAPRGRGHTT